MPATIVLQKCDLQMKRKIGTLDSGRDKIQSLTLDGVSDEASGATLLGVSTAIAGVIDDPIVAVYRNDQNLVSAGE